MDVQRFYQQVGQELRLERPQAVRVAEAALMALHLRMPEEDAQRLEEALPEELRTLWEHGGEELKRVRGSMSRFTRGQFLVYVADRLGLGDAAEAERVVRAVYGALRDQLPGADRIVRGALPADTRDLWAGLAEARR